ncbi:hypothetical protein BGW38_010076, partial [Lunasporangiospora selenospora]
MSWDEFLPVLADKHEALEKLYTAMGTPDKDKQQQNQELFDRIFGVLYDHINNLEGKKISMSTDNEAMMTNIRRMMSLVGQDTEGVQKLAETMETMTLWNQHTLLKEEHTYIYEHYKSKLEEIQELYRQLAEYRTVLGPTFVQPGPYPEEGAAVSFDVVQQFTDNIEACEKEKKRRASVVETTVITIRHIWTELGLSAQDAFDRDHIQADHPLPVTDDIMRRLEMKQSMLEAERLKRDALVKEHLADITKLWDRLRIDEDDREKFMSEHVGLTKNVIRAYKEELGRLEDIKSEKLEEFILEERGKIFELWEKLYYSLDQCQSFQPLFEEVNTDELLEEHETEVARLQQELSENELILVAIERYRMMLDEIREFEITSMDSQRLFHRDPGRLLREEKFRKMITREFPKVEAELEEALYQWQQVKGHPFLVYGEEYIYTMKLHAQQAREGKENEKLWREQRRQMILQRDLRYGSKNPNKVKTAPQSPHPRRISPPTAATPSLASSSTTGALASGRRSPPPSGNASMPQTPKSKRIGAMSSSSRPVTPTSQHIRAIPSFMGPTTPTRSRSQSVQQTNYDSLVQTESSSPIQSPRAQRHNGSSNRVYSRSESPAVSFSLSRLAPNMTNTKQHMVRTSGPVTLIAGSDVHSRRSNSVISVASNSADVGLDQQPTPTRSSKMVRPTHYDLTGQTVVEEEEDFGSSSSKSTGAPSSLLRTPRKLKRTAEEMSSPIHSPPDSPLVQPHGSTRRRSRSVSPSGSEIIQAGRQMESPFLTEKMSLHSLRGGGSSEFSSAIRPPAQFMKQLLAAQEQSVDGGYDDDRPTAMLAGANNSRSHDNHRGRDPTTRNSVVELDAAEAAKIFLSAPRKRTARTEPDVVEIVEELDSEGWETDNEDSPQSRRRSKNPKLSSQTAKNGQASLTETGQKSTIQIS